MRSLRFRGAGVRIPVDHDPYVAAGPAPDHDPHAFPSCGVCLSLWTGAETPVPRSVDEQTHATCGRSTLHQRPSLVPVPSAGILEQTNAEIVSHALSDAKGGIVKIVTAEIEKNSCGSVYSCALGVAAGEIPVIS